ncbi:MAG: 2-C-methyl-D-erythritol 2,4-cyclodiphosphate synthase [Terriglobales bacterium]
MRVGQGWDSHAFASGRKLWLGGVEIPHDRGLAGHSDGDVLAHAVCDAILGALGAGDIGGHFSPNEERWRNASSLLFLQRARVMATESGWRIANVDSTVILAAPKLAPHRAAMQQSLATALGLAPEQVSVKAKTPEGLPFADVALAHSVVLLLREVERDQ